MNTYDYNYYDTYSTVDTEAVGALAGGAIVLFLVFMLIIVAISLCAVIGQWKAFKKAGKGGWEAIIPVYSQVVLCQITGVNPWWILIVFLGSLVLSIIPVIGSLASTALSIYFMVILYVSTARSFGKSDGFAAGLYFLAPIFWLILGGKNSQYQGPRPMNDVIMNLFNKNGNSNATPNMNNNMSNNMNNMAPQGQQMNSAPVNPAQPAEKFCTGCGYKVTNGERFCPGCGKEML